MTIKIDPKFHDAYLTHNFDFTSPINYKLGSGLKYIDYKCKICGAFLMQGPDKLYTINYVYEYNDCSGLDVVPCNDHLMEQVLK